MTGRGVYVKRFVYVTYTIRHKPTFRLLIDLRAVIGVPKKA